jgi:hypothetical protein
MTLNEFRQSLTVAEPTGLSFAVAGLWWDAKGHWTRAHESAQQDGGLAGYSTASRDAYHRKLRPTTTCSQSVNRKA